MTQPFHMYMYEDKPSRGSYMHSGELWIHDGVLSTHKKGADPRCLLLCG